MTTSLISALNHQHTLNQQNQNHYYQYCTLVWRRGQLLVKPLGKVTQPNLPAIYDEQSLVKCLKHSPVKLVRIDPKLGEARLNLWANACEQASKPLYLRVPAGQKHLVGENFVSRLFIRLVDWLVALLFLLAMSPIALIMVLLMRLSSSEPLLEREWHVGERGRLFRGFKFRATTATQKTGLHNLPLLLNVLRGEMGLIGVRCWTLAEALKLSTKEQQLLNQLPGVVGSWQVEQTDSNQLLLDSVNSFEV